VPRTDVVPVRRLLRRRHTPHVADLCPMIRQFPKGISWKVTLPRVTGQLFATGERISGSCTETACFRTRGRCGGSTCFAGHPHPRMGSRPFVVRVRRVLGECDS
jgi:hypothetical protein